MVSRCVRGGNGDLKAQSADRREFASFGDGHMLDGRG